MKIPSSVSILILVIPLCAGQGFDVQESIRQPLDSALQSFSAKVLPAVLPLKAKPNALFSVQKQLDGTLNRVVDALAAVAKEKTLLSIRQQNATKVFEEETKKLKAADLMKDYRDNMRDIMMTGFRGKNFNVIGRLDQEEKAAVEFLNKAGAFLVESATNDVLKIYDYCSKYSLEWGWTLLDMEETLINEATLHLKDVEGRIKKLKGKLDGALSNEGAQWPKVVSILYDISAAFLHMHEVAKLDTKPLLEMLILVQKLAI